MKLLLIAGFAVLSLLFASAGQLHAPIAGDDFSWAAGIPLDSPK